MIFGRFECYPGKSTKVHVQECSMKRTSRIGSDRINFLVELNVLAPITQIRFHSALYFKHQAYRKTPIELSEDICDWLNKKKRSSLLDATLGLILKFIQYDHKLECPLVPGNMSMKAYNVSLNDQFPMIPLLPSGQYRMDSTLFEGQRNPFVSIKFFMTISDKRVEQYDNFDDLKNLQQKQLTN